MVEEERTPEGQPSQASEGNRCSLGDWMVGFDGDWGVVQKSNSRVVVGYSNQKVNFQNMEEELFNFKDKLKDIYF